MGTTMFFLVFYERIIIVWGSLLIAALLLLVSNPSPNNKAKTNNKQDSPFSKLSHHYATKVFNRVRAISTIFSKAKNNIIYTPCVKSQPDYSDNHSLVHTDTLSQPKKASQPKGNDTVTSVHWQKLFDKYKTGD